jgi:hypothetical protein
VGDVICCVLNALRFRRLGYASWINPLCSVQCVCLRLAAFFSLQTFVILFLSSNEIQLRPWWEKKKLP